MTDGRAVLMWRAPRWSGIEDLAKDQAMLLGLVCKSDVSKGLIRESGRVEVLGDTEMCDEFLRRLNKAISDYNNT